MKLKKRVRHEKLQEERQRTVRQLREARGNNGQLLLRVLSRAPRRVRVGHLAYEGHIESGGRKAHVRRAADRHALAGHCVTATVDAHPEQSRSCDGCYMQNGITDKN